MRCVLLFNPESGRGRAGRAAQIEGIAAALAGLGHTVEAVATAGPGSAALQAREMARGGVDVVFACGGDGTVHEVLQGLAGEERIALGVIPLGSANALARHLCLSLDPVEAARQQLQGSVRAIPAGRVEFGGPDGPRSRYFLVMAGAGPDGALAYELQTGLKSGLGRWAYYLHAARLFASLRFRAFEVEYLMAGSLERRVEKAICAMAVRVGDMGGIFAGLAGREASVHEAHLRLALVRPPAVLSLPLWFVSGWLGMTRLNPWVQFVEVAEFQCKALGGDSTGDAAHFEADGEWLGRIPMRVSIVPDAVRMMLPVPGEDHISRPAGDR